MTRYTRFHALCVALTLFVNVATAEVVTIADPDLEQLVRETLQLPNDVQIERVHMLQLRDLDAGGDRGIVNLTGLEYATNIVNLNLYHNPIENISPLANMTKMTGFNLWGCRVVDLSPLRNLKNLTWIVLGNNQISDISSLSELTNLTSLNLSLNQISDISPFANLVNLQHLWIDQNSVEDITILANLTQLTRLRSDTNRIHDMSPIANLTRLEELWLNRNAITDITPLTKLKNLQKLYLADNPFHDFSPLFELEGVELDIEISEGFNTVVVVPDPNLRLLIREALALPEGVPLTQGQMQRITSLDAGGDRGIVNLAGLEYATNILTLGLYHNPIEDIGPLAYMKKMTGFNLWGCRVVDLSPLRTLKSLSWIVLGNNQISDISPLAELTNLTVLHLNYNQIVDFSPLANLVNLQELLINNNLGLDISPLGNLNLTDFRYDEVCDLSPFSSVRERIENRTFPSVFQAWNDVIGLDHLTLEQRNVLHDLRFPAAFSLRWHTTPSTPTYGLATQRAGNLERAREIRQGRLAQNPNMIFLYDIRTYFHIWPEAFPPNSDFWIRDAQGQIARNSSNEYLVDFLKPEVQELIIKRIVAIERCGLYDGVFLDGFHNNGSDFVGRNHFHHATDEEIIQAYLNIFRVVRSQVREDFLILVNPNRTKPTRHAEYVNGTFMETLTDNHFSDNPGIGGYTHAGLYEIEDTLTWSEKNLRSPQINCLEGWGIPTEPPDSPDNRRWMRVFTTMSLTHSDGYVLYTTGTGVFRRPIPRADGYPWEPSHEHIWYPFWDADLGRPIGPKAQPYEDIPGLFIREFSNGWAVYNRSGKPHVITLPERVQSVRSGRQHSQHAVPDLDGDMFLRITPANPADVNDDGTVNVLDLVIVANALGTDKHDVNGDGITNVLDLVIVAQAINQ